MEGQGKRLLLAVVLALGVFMLWQLVFPQDDPKPPPDGGSGSAVVTHVPATSRVCHAPVQQVGEASVQPESLPLVFPGKLTATFSKWGGTLASWKLADPRYEKDATKGELLPPQSGYGAFAVGFWEGSSRCLPAKTEWALKKLSDTQIEATYAFAGMAFTKTYTVDAENFSVHMALKIVADVSKGDFQQKLTISTFAWNDPQADTKSSMQIAAREWSSATYRDGDLLNTPKDELKNEKHGVQPRFEQNITWTGFEHPYLLAAYAPKKLPVPGDAAAKHTYPLEPDGLIRTDIEFPATAFTGKQTELVREIVAYLGPKNYGQLKDADKNAVKAGVQAEFATTIDLGWFAIIGRPLMWLLIKFHEFTGNWAIAIILLTFLVKGLTLYWTTKSMRSMKQMAALAPQMKALQEKYKNDRARIQAETMALYKQHNVNPIAGCLPILLQMPVWIALYRMLSSAGELYQEVFIPGWIDDLTNTDPYHILPVVLLVTMFVQARMTPVSGDSRQQKIMLYGMPLMFGVMSFFFPAGLTLYIFTNTCLSALHSIYMNKYDKKSIAIAAQLKANAEAVKAAEAKPAAKPAAKPVIDAASTEKDRDDDESASEAKPAATASRPHQQRKKKKRRR